MTVRWEQQGVFQNALIMLRDSSEQWKLKGLFPISSQGHVSIAQESFKELHLSQDHIVISSLSFLPQTLDNIYSLKVNYVANSETHPFFILQSM